MEHDPEPEFVSVFSNNSHPQDQYHGLNIQDFIQNDGMMEIDRATQRNPIWHVSPGDPNLTIDSSYIAGAASSQNYIRMDNVDNDGEHQMQKLRTDVLLDLVDKASSLAAVKALFNKASSLAAVKALISELMKNNSSPTVLEDQETDTELCRLLSQVPQENDTRSGYLVYMLSEAEETEDHGEKTPSFDDTGERK